MQVSVLFCISSSTLHNSQKKKTISDALDSTSRLLFRVVIREGEQIHSVPFSRHLFVQMDQHTEIVWFSSRVLFRENYWETPFKVVEPNS